MTDDWALTLVLVGLGLGVAGLLMFVLSACVQSGNDAEHERRIEALRALSWQEWPADGSDGSEPDDVCR